MLQLRRYPQLNVTAIAVDARTSAHVRPALAAPATSQPTTLSSASIESAGLFALQYVGESSHLRIGKNSPAKAPVSLSHGLTHGTRSLLMSAPVATCDEAEIIDSASSLPRLSLEVLFQRVAFKQESAQVLCDRVQQGCCRVVWARSTAQDLHWPGVPLVVGTAFAVTAVLDGRSCATIWNVCVDPAWQHRGLGMTLVMRLVHLLQHEDEVQQVSLCSGPETISFYTQLGFQPNPYAEVFI